MRLCVHVEYVDPSLEGEDVELDIVDPASILNDESGDAGRLLASMKLRGPVRTVRPLRRERDDDYLPHNRLSRSEAA